MSTRSRTLEAKGRTLNLEDIVAAPNGDTAAKAADAADEPAQLVVPHRRAAKLQREIRENAKGV